ncbi:MAG: Fic family protein [Spirochaetia bacterium]|nr:Fic family protein [Spirochaetia bacterium]
MEVHTVESRPAGYAYVLETLHLKGMPHWHRSYVSLLKTQNKRIQDGIIVQTYSSQYWPGEGLVSHLEFALKYDGVSLSLLAHIFNHMNQKELSDYLMSKPTGKYARRLWFFYEFLTDNRLPVDDVKIGNYVDALEGKDYYTISLGEKSSRHRVVNNLLGPNSFCPIIRKTEELSQLDVEDFTARCEAIVASYSRELIRSAQNYFYNKETKSSFSIEHINPNASRTRDFISLLELAGKEDFIEKRKLINLQNRIVDERFKDDEYRNSQNYVGQSVSYQNEIIHFISPKPEDISSLMSGLITSHQMMMNAHISPVVHAAVISYGFVFLHPFEDGNGRIHRFLIHNILNLHHMVPSNLMFPISAVMLKNPHNYDDSLEAFSRPLLTHIDYILDETGRLQIKNETSLWYKYIDMTYQSEVLYWFVNKTIDEELVEELNFLASYETTKKAIQAIIDMPDRLIDLFIKLSLQNKGILSTNERSAYFDFLTDDELAKMEKAVREGYNSST